MKNDRHKVRFMNGGIVSVDLFFKPYMLNTLYSSGMSFDYEHAFTWRKIKTISQPSSEQEERRLWGRVCVLLKTGWLKKIPIDEGKYYQHHTFKLAQSSEYSHEKYKSSKWVYALAKRAEYYLKQNRGFLDEEGSLFRRRQPKVIYIDKPVFVEKKSSSQERFIGES